MKLALEILLVMGIIGAIYSMYYQQFTTHKIQNEDE